MSDRLEPEVLMREISGLEDRLGELRQAVAMPELDVRATLDAALIELELALSALRTLGSNQTTSEGRAAAAEAERRVLRTVFQDAPVPLFLMDRDGGIRRVNLRASELLGTSPGYVAGKPFTVFCDLPTRAALRSQLAAVVRSGRSRRADVRFLSKKAPVRATVTLARAWIRGEPEPLVVAVATPVDGPPSVPAKAPAPAEAHAQGGPPTQAEPSEQAGSSERRTTGDEAAATVVHRMDVLATAGELLLDEPVFNESVAIRRCARLLAAELADWVIVDVEFRGELRRQVVLGPGDDRAGEIARVLEAVDPSAGTLPHTVHTRRQTALYAHVEDLELLGTVADGASVCGLMSATSVLSVPIEDHEKSLGTITLTCGGENGPFDLLDLGVVQRLGRHLALVIRAARMYRRRAEVADTLQASLLPRELPAIPGLRLAARYLGATRGVEVGGDFYDVFETPKGWGFVLGDVCGKGEEAAAVTATARHGIRLLSRWHAEPAEVLGMVNEALLSEERFVTAVLVGVTTREGRVSVTLSTAGHPPAIVVRQDGVIRVASTGGVPLGLFDDFEAGLETLDLSAGDTLFLHSDGVLDACDLMNERFGQERLIEVLAANSGRPVGEMLIAVEQALLDFCHGDLRDDLSILALRVPPQVLN